MNVSVNNLQWDVRDAIPCRDCPERACCALVKKFEPVRNEKLKEERAPVKDRDVPSYRHAEIF
jgi:hypothetical protein